MNSRINTLIKTLVISRDTNQGDHLINMLRQAGLSILAEEVKDESWLVQNLPRKQWDLLLIFADNNRVDPHQALAQIQRMDIDIPCIVINPEESTTQNRLLIEAGIKDLVQLDDTFAFTHSIHRELIYLEERRKSRKNALDLRELQKRYQLLLDSASNAIAYIHEGMHIYANKAYIELFGYKQSSELISVPFMDLVIEKDREKVKEFLRSDIKDENTTLEFVVLHHQQHLNVSMHCTQVIYEEENSLQIIVEPAKGNREHKESSAKLKTTDLLTGLLNKQSLNKEIDKAISMAITNNARSALIVIQLQHFDEVATVIGKSDGNLLLSDCGRFLKNISPPEALVGRLDNSEFAILLFEMSHEDMSTIVKRISQEMENALADKIPPALKLNCVSGMAPITEKSPNAEIIIARAKHDLVCSEFKPENSHGIIEFEKKNKSELVLKMINSAFSQDRYRLVFQPIVSLKEDGLEHYELRIRMKAGKETIYPPRFLEVVHQNGLGEKLDRWVISQALDRLKLQENQNVRFTINLTHNSVTSESLLPWLNKCLQKHRISTDYLVLQISEIDIMSSYQHVVKFCSQLDELNIKLSVTHFGCTLNPFQYLAKLPAYFVKLDKSLLNDLDFDDQQQERLEAIVSGLHAKGIRVIAPMIDKIKILPLVWQAEVNFVQGNCLREPSDKMDFNFVEDEEITLDSF